MSGVLADGNVFDLYGDQSKYSSGRLIATMTIAPGWDDLLNNFSYSELISFVGDMGTGNSTALVKRLRDPEANQAELREILIQAFSSTTP